MIASAAYVRLEWPALMVALGLVVVAILLARVERVGYTGVLLVGTVRTIAQLLAIGFVLRGVFEIAAWWLNFLVLLVMVGVATFNAVRRQETKTPGYAWIAAVSLLAGAISVVLYVVLLVVRPSPWFEAQYLIPIGGMIIAYAMNAMTLYKNRFDSELSSRRGEIEAKLALGATSRRAAEEAVRQSFRAALLPSVNFMMVVGLVQIPGMMGGQIIGGGDPLDAALYQMLVAFQLVSAAMIACFVTARLTFRKAFTKAHQLR